jgi:hypothetical protein
MSTAAIVLAAAAVPIGLTGTWSPCGFSMIETLGMRGHSGRLGTTIAACATFAPGAVVGGALTFGLLGAAGGLVHGVGGSVSYLVAAVIAVIAAAAEVRRVRIVPQVRRQLPETWRWRMPLPIAAGLYGVLLGLGFTTFVLSFGAWALAAISFAVGDPIVGVAIGIAFGIGRALPIVALAPLADRPAGIRAVAAMAERPALYGRARLGDGVALMVVAATLGAAAATAAPSGRIHGADPSVAAGQLAYQQGHRGQAVLRRGGRTTRLPGREPAIGGRLAVVRVGRGLEILRRRSRHAIADLDLRGVWASAISGRWLAFTQSGHGDDILRARRLEHGRPASRAHVVARVHHPARLGHPGLDGRVLVFAVSRRRGNTVMWRRLGGHGRGVVARTHRGAVCCPSVRNGRVLFVHSIRRRQSAQETSAPPLEQHLMLARIGSHRARSIYARRSPHGTLFSTALSARRAYVTVMHRRSARITHVRR